MNSAPAIYHLTSSTGGDESIFVLTPSLEASERTDYENALQNLARSRNQELNEVEFCDIDLSEDDIYFLSKVTYDLILATEIVAASNYLAFA